MNLPLERKSCDAFPFFFSSKIQKHLIETNLFDFTILAQCDVCTGKCNKSTNNVWSATWQILYTTVGQLLIGTGHETLMKLLKEEVKMLKGGSGADH